MKPPLTNFIILLFALLTTLLTTSLAHPVHVRTHQYNHPARAERIPFYNNPNFGTKAPETPQPMMTVISTKPIPSPFPSPTPGVAPKPAKSCLDLALWATASGPSPMMMVAGSLSKNGNPICSIWTLINQSSKVPVPLNCSPGHTATFEFNSGRGSYRYVGDKGGEPVNFPVLRKEEQPVDGKEAWSWSVRGCWDE